MIKAYEKESRAIAQLAQVRVQIDREQAFPHWLTHRLGQPEYLKRVKGIAVLNAAAMTPEAISLFHEFDSLESLYIDGSSELPASLTANLRGLNHLKHLSVGSSKPAPEVFSQIAISQMRGLTSLTANGRRIGDDGAMHLRDLRSLTSLNLTGNELTEKGVESLRLLSQLEYLSLSFNLRLNDDCAGDLAMMRNLKTLDLEFTKFGNAGIRTLALLPRLETLNLTRTRISDECLESIRRMPCLRKLMVSRSVHGLPELTDRAIAELRKWNSQLEVVVR